VTGEGTWGGMTDAEIGKQLGMSSNLVGRVAKQALAKVRERLSWTDEQLHEFVKRERTTAHE
ncbi:hypothetical protein RGC28_08480, partial [Helicobacter pylori]|uniref:hypothetical protein n=1 Tax=Helicobacter pylori TaxID=210 RepID=UPI002927F97F